MTLFLASVTGPDEADIALANGADVIDLKDPTAGALGAVSLDTVRAAVAHVAGRRPVSAVAGDLPMRPETIAAAVSALAETGVEFVKVGLFPGARRADCIRALAPLARRTKLVGVMFADDGLDPALLPLMAEGGFAGAMLDTARKNAGRLLDHAGIAGLKDFVTACRKSNLFAGLAGSLEPPDIPRLLLIEPDYLGFRRALCRQARAGRVDADCVALIRGLIPLDPRSAAHRDPPAAKVDYRLLAARGYAVDAGKIETATDRVVVRDFVLPVRIGAYAHERERPQNVRFNIDVKVLRPGHAVEDMRDIFSYDVVTDGIRMLVAHEHITLIETLAERVAALILAKPRVVAVTVRAEKLDVGPGAVGVEILRERPPEVARAQQLYPVPRREADPKTAE
jgi:(5-formylfuran-3-yl)methyl phosphate synthase